MPKELSWSHEGENQQSDQVSTRRDASSRNGGQVRDFATWAFQRHEKQRREAEQRRDGKGPALAEIDTKRAIAENGDFVPRTVNLASESTEDNPKLLGGGDNKSIAWNTLINNLTTIKDEYDTALKNGKKGDISANAERSINKKLEIFRGLLNKYRPLLDYSTLTNIEDHVPGSAKEAAFIGYIESCLAFAEYGSKDT